MTGILLSLKGGVMNPMRKVSRVLRRRVRVLKGSWGGVEESGDARGEDGDWSWSRTRWAMSRRVTRRGRSLED